MSFLPCILIPIYNHGATIHAVVDRLLPHGYPIIIVDDGSDETTQAILARLAAGQPLVRLFREPINGGKGAAMIRGLREALAAGFSHALQVDADGQHDLADVPRFLALGRETPEAVICGQPKYDACAPAGRRYGRYVTHFWVWLETLSFAIGDSMCGFRLYPLQPTVYLIDRVRMPLRMSFDIELVVRLHWLGLPIRNLETRVIYPEGGLSHFDLWRDNLRISAMHSRLCLGLLWRWPILLVRRLWPGAVQGQHWSRHEERGAAWGLRLSVAAYQFLGRRAAKILLRPVVAWFFLTGKTARQASRAYLERLGGPAQGMPAPTWFNCFRHMLAFADSGVDKLAAWTGDLAHDEVAFPDQPAFEALLASGRGALLLGAHLGNLEMSRALANLGGIARINAVVYTEHAKRFTHALSSANRQFEINLIQVDQFGPDTAILLREKIDRGELLVIVGDRTPPAETGRVVMAEFLGQPAPFPVGPYVLAALLECPVFLFLCLREEEGYRLHFEPFADKVELPRKSRLQALEALARAYAQRLEVFCRKAPLQWFNFFDFWAGAPRRDSGSSLH